MTNQYRTEQLANASEKSAAALAKFNAAKIGSKQRREAAEDYEFWSNKAAFLDAIKTAA